MALLEELLIRLGIDTSDVDGAAARVDDQLGGIAKAANAAGLAAGAALAVGFDNALGKMTAITDLQRDLGLTKVDAENLAKATDQVFRTGLVGSIQDANAAIVATKSTFKDMANASTADIAKVSEQAIVLSKTLGTDVPDAARAAQALVRNGFVKSSKEGLDLLTAAAPEFPKAMRAELPEVISEYGDGLARIGIDGAQAFGLLSQFVQAGGKDIDEGADLLNEFGRIATEEPKKAGEAFKALKLPVKDTLNAIAQGGPEGEQALNKVLTALRNTKDPAEQAALATQIFGDRAGDSVKALLAMDPATAGAQGKLNDFAGSAEKATNAAKTSPMVQFNSVMNTLKSTLGDAVLPILVKASQMFAKHEGAIKAAIPAVLAIVAALGTLAALRWAAILVTQSVQAVMAFARVSRAAMTSAATGARAAATWIAAQARAAASMAATAARVAAGWVMMAARAMASAVRMAAAWLISMGPVGIIIAIVIALVALIVANWDTVKKWTIAAWNFIWEWIKKIFNFLKNLFLNFTGPGLIIKHWDKIKAATLAAWNWVWNKIKAVFNFLKNLFMNFTGPGLIIKHWDKIKSATTAAWNAVKRFVGNALTAIKNFIMSRLRAARNAAVGAFNAIKNTIRNAINAGKSAVVRAVGTIVGKIRSIKSKAKSALSGAVSWLRSAGKNIIRGLINGIKAMAGSAVSAAKGVVKGAINGAKNLLGIGSPSKVFMEIGEFTTEGLSIGLVDDLRQIDKAAERMMAPLDSRVDSARKALMRPTPGITNGRVASAVATPESRIQIDVDGADEGMKELIRRIMRTSNLVVN